MRHFASNWVVESLRTLFQRRIGDAVPAYLGDKDGPGARTDVPGRMGYMYVRLQRNSPPFMARSGDASYPNYPGAPVYVAYRYNGEPEIVGTNYKALDGVGIDSRVLNSLNQQSKWVYNWQWTWGLVNAVANSVTASKLVTVKFFRYYVGNRFQVFETPLEADKIDLSAYIPGEDEHRYAAIWIDTYTNLPEVTVSVTQPLSEPFDATDVQELTAGRPPDAMPLKAFALANDQATITQTPVNEVELRQLLDTPVLWGFPNELTTRERVWPDRTLVVGPYTESGDGDLALEAGARVIIVHKGNVTTTAPTVNDDSGDGYSVGSEWFNKTTGLLYVATDVTVGAAVWDEVASGGSGGMTSFDVIGDTGDTAVVVDGTLLDFEGAGGIVVDVDNATKKVTIDGSGYAYIWNVDADNVDVQPVLNADVVNILGGTGIETAIVSGPDVTIHISDTGVVQDTYDYPAQIVVNAQGQIQDIVAGSAPGTMSSFNVSGDAGTPQTIANANTLNIAGGAGIDTATSATDVLIVAVDNTVIRTTGTQSIGAGLTVDTPTITNLTNMQHDHQDADDGGQLTGAAINVTAHNAVIGNGASGLTSLAPSTSRNVMISDGTDWTSRALALADVPNAIAIFRDEKTTGTNGGSSAATTWNARDLNTELYDPGGIVSISSNQFVPVGGDYEITILTPFAGAVGGNALGRCRLYNVTGAASVEEGQNTYALTNGPATAFLQCKFTANGSDAYRVDTYTSTARVTIGLGAQVGDGSAEVYTCVYLRKIA